MSGFFAMRREVFERLVRRTSGMGFKLLLDVLASSPHPLRFIELPYEFRSRQAGESKLDSQVAWDYVMLLLDKSIGDILPRGGLRRPDPLQSVVGVVSLVGGALCLGAGYCHVACDDE